MRKCLILFTLLLFALFVAVITDDKQNDSYGDEVVFSETMETTSISN